MGVFENIFLNPTTPTTIEFTANINSELGDSDIQYEYIDIDCFSKIQTKENTDILVYPNPNKGVFNVNTNENTKMTVYNLNGKIVFQEDLKMERIQFTFQFKKECILLILVMKRKLTIKNYNTLSFIFF